MNNSTVTESRYLNPGHKMNAALPRSFRRSCMTRSCIVVGQRDHRDACVGYLVDKGNRVEATIAVVAVQMEITDHACATKFSPLPD